MLRMARSRGPSRVQPLASSSEALGDDGDVEAAFAAHAEAEVGGGGWKGRGHFAEEDGGVDAGDADEMVDDALAVLDGSTGEFHFCEGDEAPCDEAARGGAWACGVGRFDGEIAECRAEETDLAGGVGEIDGLCDAVGIGSTFDEVACEAESGGVGGGVGESAGVGEDCGIEAVGDGGRDGVSGEDGEVVEHGSDGAGGGVDPVEVGEVSAALVVVDVEEDLGAHAGKGFGGEAGAFDGVAFEEDGGIWRGGGKLGGDAVDSGKDVVDGRDGLGEGDDDLLSHGFEEVHEAEGGSDGIAVGSRVRGNKETVPLVEQGEQIADVGFITHDRSRWILRACCLRC
jgi:hypothetical protein